MQEFYFFPSRIIFIKASLHVCSLPMWMLFLSLSWLFKRGIIWALTESSIRYVILQLTWKIPKCLFFKWSLIINEYGQNQVLYSLSSSISPVAAWLSQMPATILVLLCSVAFLAFVLPNHVFFLKLSGKVHWNPSSKLLKAIPQYWNKKLTRWSWLAWEHCFFPFRENIKPHLCCQKLAKYVSMLPWGEKYHRFMWVVASPPWTLVCISQCTVDLFQICFK